MATKTFYFSGKAKWVKTRKPNEWGKYTAQLYLDDQSLLSFKESGLKLQLREDSDGKYVQFSREHERTFPNNTEPTVFGPPPVTYNNEPFTEFVGNGSTATFKVAVYDAGVRKGHRLEAIRVDTLVPYVRVEDNNQFGNVPTEPRNF